MISLDARLAKTLALGDVQRLEIGLDIFNVRNLIEALVPGRGQPVTTMSRSLPGVSRTFAAVADAQAENADSHIYIGYHFRHAAVAGVAEGRRVGAYVASHMLLPIVKEEQ